jgi:enterochelin esterase family protein
VAKARADGATVTFRVPDPGYRLAGVRLHQDVRIPGDQLDFRPATEDGENGQNGEDGEDGQNGQDGQNGWELTIGQPPVTRMEYLLELRYRDGGAETVTDPGNPRQVDGAFGPKSVLEFAAYRPPGWLNAAAVPARQTAFAVPADPLDGPLDGAIAVRTWAPADASDDEVLPLLVVHDGPEYDTLADLTGYLAAGVAGRWLPRLRAALLGPGSRDDWYSANPRYAEALATQVIPELDARLATSVRIGMGTSLGGLAMLHAHCSDPGTFAGLFLQSGSFFSPRFDGHESWLKHYPRIVAFVAGVHRAGQHRAGQHRAGQHRGDLPGRPIPTVLTCGAIEENLPGNRLMEQSLRKLQYPVELHELPDVHNYTAWRDGFDPQLTRLLNRVCG